MKAPLSRDTVGHPGPGCRVTLGERTGPGHAWSVAEPPVDVTQTAHDGGGRVEGRTRWALRIVHCPDPEMVGRVMSIDDEDGVTIGRTEGPQTDLVVSDRLLSRRHATLAIKGPVVELADHESKNGSFLDGKRCRVGVVREDSVIRLGNTLLVLTPAEPTETSNAALLGDSDAMREAVAALDRVADQPVDVLVLGETGTGKELAARHLHERSGRKGELVAVNCGAIPDKLIESYLFGHRKGAFTGATSDQPGVFERADGGTLLLDEVGELPLELQPRLLRVLESREFVPVGSTTPRSCDVRVVSSTNVELEAACERGEFRPDLYARLAGYVVRLPPLRSRRGDVPGLFHHFVRSLAPDRSFQLDGLFVERLMLHDWPLNAREVRSLAQRLLVDSKSDALTADDLPSSFGQRAGPTSEPAPAGPPGRDELEAALRENDGSVAALAARYGKDRKQVYRWLKKHGLEPDAYRS